MFILNILWQNGTYESISIYIFFVADVLCCWLRNSIFASNFESWIFIMVRWIIDVTRKMMSASRRKQILLFALTLNALMKQTDPFTNLCIYICSIDSNAFEMTILIYCLALQMGNKKYNNEFRNKFCIYVNARYGEDWGCWGKGGGGGGKGRSRGRDEKCHSYQ